MLQLVVPGWYCSSAVLLSEGAHAPHAWGQWPGVVVFDGRVMDRGDSAAATPCVLQPADDTPAAVFCQEVGIVQLAGSVKELRSAVTAVTATDPLGGKSGGAGHQHAAFCKVLKKPRMFLAV